MMSSTRTGNQERLSLPLCPFPSCPCWLLPQQDMVPSWCSAQECPLPAVMAVASVMPVTCTGTDESALPEFGLSPPCPFPSCPQLLLPQQDMVPSWWSAQECPTSAVMAVASIMPKTCTGTEDMALFPPCPFPSCPQLLRPQHEIVLSWWSAQE